MTDLESIKVYYYEDSSWNQISGIVQFPTITKRMDNTSMCSIRVSDFEGALYASWNPRDFTKMKIEDADENILFQGYLQRKEFDGKSMLIIIEGFAALMEHTPFKKNYILASGLVKTVPYDPGIDGIYDLDPVVPIGICWDGTNYFVSAENNNTYKYTTSFVEVTHYDMSGDVSTPRGICYCSDDGHFYVVSKSILCFVYEYNSAFVLQDSHAIDESSDPWGICFDGYNFFIVDKGGYVYRYASDFTYEATFNITSFTTTPAGIVSDGRGEFYYITDYADNKMYKVSANFVLLESFDLDDSYTIPGGLEFANNYFMTTFGGAVKSVGRYLPSFLLFDEDTFGLELKQDDVDNDYPDFEWGADDWINNRDVAILIQDNTNGAVTKTWKASAVSTDKTEIQGDEESTWTKNDGDYYYTWQGADLTDMIDTITLSAPGAGDEISTDYTPIAIRIDFWFGHKSREAKSWLYFQIKKGSDWVTIASNYRDSQGFSGTQYFGNVITLTEDLSDYLEDSDTDDDWDQLKGMRIVIDPQGYYADNYTFGIVADYISVEIDYTIDPISPIMEKIYDNGASWVVSGINWQTSGVQVADRFTIGENTKTILSDIDSRLIDIGFQLKSTLTKYMARYFRGSNCMEALKSVCQIEGLHWAEDHVNKLIIIAKEADFEDSGIDLTIGNGSEDLNLQDSCNSYRGVILYGNASLKIEAISEDPDSDSLLWKQISNDNLMTKADAQAVADAEFLKLQDKRPSYKFTITDTDGSYTALEAMKTIDLTVVRPTIAQATQPIRRVDITRVGGDIKYTSFIGWGSTPEEEKDINLKKELASLINQLNVFRLTNSPLGAGASLTPYDIAGLDSYIESFITTESDILTWLAIGSANAKFFPLGATISHATTAVSNANNIEMFSNTTTGTINVLMSTSITTTLGSKKFYLNGTRLILSDADANNYIDTTVVYGIASNGGVTALDTDATNKNSEGTHDDTFTAVDCSSYSHILVWLILETDTTYALGCRGAFIKGYYDD